MKVETLKKSTVRESRLIGKVLSPAVQLWLRSQVEQVETLQFNIVGGDRQIVTGHIPGVAIAANHAVYQGLHLSQLQLEGTGIRVNLGQILKGKPLRLLEPVPITGELLLEQSDLQASVQAPLLSTALTDILTTLLKSNHETASANPLNDRQVSWQRIDIEDSQLIVFGTLTDDVNPTTPIVLRAGLELPTPHILKLSPLQIQFSQTSPPLNLDGFEIDLGSEVHIKELALTSGQLMCRGRLTVLP
jgi:hypothetical protein